MFACLPVCVPHVCKCPQRSEEGAGTSGTEAIDEVGAGNLNIDPLQEPTEN